MTMINNSIKQLHNHLMNNNVKTISEGVQSLNNLFFDDEIWSIEGLEWKQMNRKERSSFVKTLLSYEINDENTEENDDLRIDNIKEDIDEDLDKTTEIAEEPNDQEESYEISIQNQFVNYYIKERDTLMKNLNWTKNILNKAGYKEQPTEVKVEMSKMDIAKQFVLDNPGCSRKMFMDGLKDLGSKQMLSTYFYKLKP